MLKGHSEFYKDLLPLREELFKQFLDIFLTPEIIQSAQQRILRIKSQWPELLPEERLRALGGFHAIIFANLFPEPQSRLSFDRLSAAATFHSDQWQIVFSQTEILHDFDEVFGVWLHESYHGLLNFLSLRLKPHVAQRVICALPLVYKIALAYPLDINDLVPVTFAKRNLLGFIDRSKASPCHNLFGMDSYYLNVEINVDSLAEHTFQRVLPNSCYRRGYNKPNEYIKRRLNGESHTSASVAHPWYE